MDCNIELEGRYSNLQNLEQDIKNGRKEIMDKENEIKNKINDLLDMQPGPQSDLLHCIRTVIFKIRNNKFGETQLDSFMAYVNNLTTQTREP